MSEAIDEYELSSLIAANYGVAGQMREHEIQKKVEKVYESCNQEYGYPLDMALFLACARRNPLLFVAHGMATPAMEAEMRREGRMRDIHSGQ